MSDTEIRVSYRTAKSKKSQMQVLADLNAVSTEEMRRKLEELGCLEVKAEKKKAAPRRPFGGREPQKITLDEFRAMELFREGYDDLAMAETLGVGVTRIKDWRSQNQLYRYNQRKKRNDTKNEQNAQQTEGAVKLPAAEGEQERAAELALRRIDMPEREEKPKEAIRAKRLLEMLNRAAMAGLTEAKIFVGGEPMQDPVSVIIYRDERGETVLDFT